MPLDRRGQRRFKLGTVIKAQVIGQNGNPVGSTISGFLQDISIGGACFTAQNLKKDLGKKLLAEMTTLTFPFEKDPPISVSGQIVGADIDDSNSYTIRLQFPDQYIKENLYKLIDICKRLRKPSESQAIQQKLVQETYANAVVNFSSLGSLMDELSRVQRKLAEENPSYIDDEVVEIPTMSDESFEESVETIIKEKTITSEVPSSLTPPEPVSSKTASDLIEPEKPLEISMDEVADITIEPLEEKTIVDVKKIVSKKTETAQKIVEITPELINNPVEETIEVELVPNVQLPNQTASKPKSPKLPEKNEKSKEPEASIGKISEIKNDVVEEATIEIEVEIPSFEKPKETLVKPVEKKSDLKSKSLTTPSKASEKPKAQTRPKPEAIKPEPDNAQGSLEKPKETPVKSVEKPSKLNSKPLATPPKPSEKPKAQALPEPEVIKPEPDNAKPSQSHEKVTALIQEVRKDPKNVGLVQKLVDHYVSEGLYEDAIKSLQAVIKKNPREAEIYLLLGDTHFQAEHFQESLMPLSMALRLNPKLAKAHYIFSMANELVGKEEVGQKHYRIATMLDPNIESKV